MSDDAFLKNLSLSELKQKQAEIEKALEAARLRGREELRTKVYNLVIAEGYTMNDLLELLLPKQRKRRNIKPVVAKWRHKDDAARTWSGRGRQPVWLDEYGIEIEAE